MRILVIQTAFLGDVVLTIPLLETIKFRYPDSFLSVMLIPATKDILEGHPAINEIITYDKKGKEKGFCAFLRKVREVRGRRFDWAILPHRSFRSALLVKLAGIPRRRGFHTSQGKLFLNEIIPYRKGIHDLERNLSLLGEVERREWKNFIPLSPGAEDFVNNICHKNQIGKEEKIVALSPGSVWPTKRWPADRFACLAQRLIRDKFRVLILGSRNDLPATEMLFQKLSPQERSRVMNLGGNTGLKELAAFIHKSALLVSNDSGSIHVAAALGTPVVAIFGPTTRELGFYPYGENHQVIESHLPCRPCGPHGGRKCRVGTHQCMTDIGVEEVYRAARRLMDNAGTIRLNQGEQRRRLRILLLTYQGDEAGSTNSIIYLSKGLAQRAHKVFMGCRKESLLARVLSGTKVEVVPFPFRKKWDLACARFLVDFIKKQGIDIVNAQSSWDRASSVLARAFWHTPAKFIFTRRQMPLTWRVENWVYSFYTDRVIAVSRAVKLALAQGGFPEKKIEVVYNGLAQERVRENVSREEVTKLRVQYGLSDEEKVIGVVSRLKEHHVLIKALPLIQQPVRVFFLGIDPNPRLNRLCQKLHLSRRIIYTGFQKNILPFYKLMDITVLPSTTEGLSQTILEALALGVPVVCSDAGGNPEVIKHEENGLLFCPDDERALAENIQRLLKDEELRERIISAGRDTVQKEFTINRTVERTEEVYYDVIHESVYERFRVPE